MGARNKLANVYRDVGRVDEAIVLHEQTLAACERQLGADHARTLGSRNNLAASYQAAGRVDEAIRLYEQTLADRERLLGQSTRHRENAEAARPGPRGRGPRRGGLRLTALRRPGARLVSTASLPCPRAQERIAS